MARSTVEALLERRESIQGRIASLGDLRPGSLVGRYRKCGKPSCHCAQPGDPGHGPSWSLTHAVAGKTLTRVIPAAAVAQTEVQIEEYRRFRALSKELVEVSEAICEARLAEADAPVEAGKKNGSRASSTRRSKRKPSG
jgi:hypothetical protein